MCVGAVLVGVRVRGAPVDGRFGSWFTGVSACGNVFAQATSLYQPHLCAQGERLVEGAETATVKAPNIVHENVIFRDERSRADGRAHTHTHTSSNFCSRSSILRCASSNATTCAICCRDLTSSAPACE